MKFLIQSYKAQVVTLLFIWIVSMLFSAEFVLSIAMFLLVLMALFQLQIEGQNIRFGMRADLKANFRRYWNNKAYIFISIPFFLVLLSAFWSGDGDYTLERLRIKLPFLILPFAFVSMPRLKKPEVLTVLYFLLIIMTVACIYVGMNYLANFDAVNEMIGKGKPIPTPSNHIRFSLVLGFSIISGMALYYEGFYLQYRWERWLIPILTLFLFGFIHILAVRSGLIVLYLAIFFTSIRYAYLTRRFAVVGAVLLALVSLPVLTYQTIPSFRQKVNYARWDFLQYTQGTGQYYSDSERFLSMEVGLKIGNQHPLFGVGAGDLKKEVIQNYETTFDGQQDPKMPHSQFLTIYAGTGLCGLLLFLFGFFFPLFYKRQYQSTLFLAFHVIIFFSFFMENTIENNFGVSFYLLGGLLGLRYLEEVVCPDSYRE
ncbi:MAG: O-antigen ligase family protein [Saprospiraceae bacterium]|nr:O-antigen ligase family protein [Saprospiraceae bacterium]